jgi:hypothetical protein
MKMKKVIAFYGASNRGKSATLKMVYQSLSKSFDLLPEKSIIPDKHGTHLLNELHDIRAIFMMNGVRVGIESQGDPNSRLEDSLRFFQNNKCRIIVCPTRTRGGTVKCVERLKPEFEVEWTKKTVADDASSQTSCNKADATKITKLIKVFVQS